VWVKLDDIPYPKVPRRLPTIFTVDEVTRLIDGARTLTDRTMFMILYSTERTDNTSRIYAAPPSSLLDSCSVRTFVAAARALT
jgi:hypothetical protein